MTITRPRARLATGGGGGPFGGGDLDLLSAGAHRLVVDLGIGTAHDRAELVVSHLSPLADTTPGTELTVGLGAGDEPEDVLTVEITSAVELPGWRRLVGLAPSHKLDALYLGRTYVRQSVADIVGDVLGEADVATGTIDGSRTLGQYHVDGQRSAWLNLHRLAQLFGAVVTSDPDGAVSFQPAPGVTGGGPGAALAGAASAALGAAASVIGLGGDGGWRRGANVVTWRTGGQRSIGEPALAALGAASPYGSDRGHHVLKSPDGGSGPKHVSPSLRDTDSADAATQAVIAATDRRRRGGRVTVLGDPTLRAGSKVTIDDDEWFVRSVRHRVDPIGGYLCELHVEATA